MEQKLKNLFDFQKFEKNSSLKKIIDDYIKEEKELKIIDFVIFWIFCIYDFEIVLWGRKWIF